MLEKSHLKDQFALLILLAVVLATNLPFLGKAFHLDDTVFIWLAEEKLSNPLALGLADHAFAGQSYSLYLDTHPPLLASYLAVLIWLAGGASEVSLQLGSLLWPVLAAVSMYFLAKRLTESPLLSSLLLVLTPGFMVMSQSVMTDVPALALWLAAVAAYVYAVDEVRPDERGSTGRRPARYARNITLAALFTALAILTTYQSFSLIPLLLLYALLTRRLNVLNAVPPLAGLLVFAGVIIFYQLSTGGLPKLSYSGGLGFDPAFLAQKMLSIVSVIGGATVFTAALIAGQLRGRRDYFYLAALAALLAVVMTVQVARGQYGPLSGVLQLLFYTAGMLTVYRMLPGSRPRESRDGPDGVDLFLGLWFLGVISYSVLLLPYGATRYLLPLFPPLILMFVRFARSLFANSRAWKRFAFTAVLLTAATGLALSEADYIQSGNYRDFASREAPALTSEGRQLWFAGEFGLRYYLEKAGGRYLTADDNSPVSGDRVVVSRKVIAHFLSGDLTGRLELERTIDYPSAWPFRVQDSGSQAGFYGQFHGNLPFSLSTEPVESIDIYVVR